MTDWGVEKLVSKKRQKKLKKNKHCSPGITTATPHRQSTHSHRKQGGQRRRTGREGGGEEGMERERERWVGVEEVSGDVTVTKKS